MVFAQNYGEAVQAERRKMCPRFYANYFIAIGAVGSRNGEVVTRIATGTIGHGSCLCGGLRCTGTVRGA